MAIATIRRLAADILHVGENKIRISPDSLKEAEGALTRVDVKGLIDKGIITKLKPQGRASTRKKERRSVGKRRGIMMEPKDAWMMKVRAQRRLLRTLTADGALKKGTKRSVYGKVKSGIFRNKRAMLIYLKDNGLVAKDYEPAKAAFVKKAGKPGTPPKAKPAAVKPPEQKAPVHREAQPSAVNKKGESR
ncbi:MAG: 50S ribosomal protein L19e [Candidatus ainarchaeum sp.]|nr:50S ribosomal protein L19e [Candidatus ainarchaeum sp.]